jgi:hypothetical protein
MVTMVYRKRMVACKFAPCSKIEFAAAHEKTTMGIGADESAFLIEQLGAAEWTQVPPVFLFVLLGRG